MEHKETAVFGGGCFWCTEAVFSAGGGSAYGGKKLKGIISVTPGYAGGLQAESPEVIRGTGDLDSALEAEGPEQKRGIGGPEGNPSATSGSARSAPTYEEVCSGMTGHAEVVRVEFDPGKITFRDLLTVFFGTHDPTTLNQQGADIGTQYRSTVLYTTENQKLETENFIKEINESNSAGAPVVTEVRPLTQFFEAEDYHKDYFNKNPGNPYCAVVINPKLKKVQERFAKLLAQIP